MKLIYLIPIIFSLVNCGSKDTSRVNIQDKIEKSGASESVDSVQLKGYVILYDTQTAKAVDTLLLSEIVMTGPIKKSSYPSSQKATTICNDWNMDDQMLKKILKISTPISNGIWHYAYDHLACSYEAEFKLNSKTYKMSINGGSWISIYSENLEGKIGCVEKNCVKIFLSEPLPLDELNSKN